MQYSLILAMALMAFITTGTSASGNPRAPNDMIGRKATELASALTIEDVLRIENIRPGADETVISSRLKLLWEGKNLPRSGAEVNFISYTETTFQPSHRGNLYHPSQDKRGAPGRLEGRFDYELKFPSEERHIVRILIAQITDRPATFNILSKKVTSAMIADEQMNLAHRSLIQLLGLMLAYAIPLFIISSLFVAAQSPGKKPWGLMLFSVVGIGRFDLNWSNGDYYCKLPSLILFGFQITKNYMEPWVLTYSIPLGAILIWRNRFKSASREAGAFVPGQPS